MVELTLIAAALFLLIIGIFEVARFVYGVNAISNGAREGARYSVAASHSVGGTACTSVNAGVQSAAEAQMSGIGLFGTDVVITASEDPSSPASWCQITVTWKYRPASGGFGYFANQTIVTTAREYYN